MLTINILYNNPSQINEISIIDEIGKTIKFIKFTNIEAKTLAKVVDISELKTGYYQIIIKTDNEIFVRKFIKQ